ncbi:MULTISPECIES: hypothetical protein [Pseudomonas]|uniref:hypothetical protein n=1 Tax=Pseudomonas TaxID=286 RepID=UPI0005EBC108|nr:MULTISPECIES: hypothetical protein [Pseudomonas]KJK14883.1 hypothetical protein UB48_24120 [Pseudomonas sp. 2(2015)]PJY94704.1 hypothetical protein COO64_20385 [Pseudomonas donghuensis]QVM94178.1 hypothetical protein JYG36_13685 [Pseudomonas sp. SORT22]WKY29660.1 hypothetical protein QYF67_06570 [Pseudomonas donghuensis]SPO68112.1 conserved protein of unknown function [Pseudomonas sp. JV241A]
MASRSSVEGYVHFEGFDSFERDAFDKSKIRAAMRKAGRLVTQRAQMNLALGKGQDGYPVNRTGATLESINFKVSRAGFLVRIAPRKTSSMKEFYPAYLHYGVKKGNRPGKLAPGMGKGKSNRRAKGDRALALAARAAAGWRITPRDNYMADALQDSRSSVQALLSAAFAAALN